ncbi:hypothetical protein LJC56_01850 [Christensenellaceae bacterium OttesenSCG-928-K19]|nr:hypothetical protein [Christensenellaceae bacterium OttesenSCG-928-K19]
MKKTVLVVNPREEERGEWKKRLTDSGYTVLDAGQYLSEMVRILSHAPVDYVVCSSELITGAVYEVLSQIHIFFPKVRMIVVGWIQLERALPNLAKVSFRNEFDSNLEEGAYCQMSLPPQRPEDILRLLLREHFLSGEQAAALLRDAGYTCNGELTVLVLNAKPYIPYDILQKLPAEFAKGASVLMDAGEACIVLCDCGDPLKTADALRVYLLENIDISFSIGISRSRKKVSELFISRREALRASLATHEYGLDSVVHIDYLDKKDIWYAYPHHKENRMIEYAMDGDAKQAIALLDELFSFLEKREEQLSERYIRSVGLRIWAGMGLAASSRLLAYETLQMDAMSFGKLVTSKNWQDMYAFLKEGILQVSLEMEAIQEVARDALYTRLSSLRAKGESPLPEELVGIFHTTIGFLNDAVTQNSKDTIFNFFQQTDA